MENLEIEVSISPIDLLKHVSNMYKTKQYSEVKVRKLIEETQRFNNQLLKNTYTFSVKFDEVKRISEMQRNVIKDMTDKLIQQPELTSVYQPLITSMMHENTELMKGFANMEK